MFDRVAIKNHAKTAFQNQFGISVAAFVLYAVITASLSGATFGIAALFIAPPLIVGYASFCMRIFKNEAGDIGDMFTKGFSDYLRNLGGILWMYLFVWLWSLLFVIPGIVKAIAYSMTPYILTDCPRVDATEALKLSMRMTRGYKGDIFVFYLSFLGWWILSALTFGILGLVYVGPYYSTGLAGVYLDLKAKALQNGVIRPEELA